jgi:uncharacterized protein (TIGR03067 family)
MLVATLALIGGFVMRKLAVVLAFLVLAAEEKKSDEELIQGGWIVVSGEQGGEKLPERVVKGFLLTFASGGKLTVLDHGDSKESTFKLDAAKKPKQIDMTADDKSGKGICELDGDSLKICMSEEGDRPTEFKSPKGSKVALAVLKRLKK